MEPTKPLTNKCVLIGGIIYCQCGDPSSHYGTMGERGAREVRCEAPPTAQAPSKELVCAVCAEPWRLGHRCKPTPTPGLPEVDPYADQFAKMILVLTGAELEEEDDYLEVANLELQRLIAAKQSSAHEPQPAASKELAYRDALARIRQVCRSDAKDFEAATLERRQVYDIANITLNAHGDLYASGHEPPAAPASADWTGHWHSDPKRNPLLGNSQMGWQPPCTATPPATEPPAEPDQAAMDRIFDLWFDSLRQPPQNYHQIFTAGYAAGLLRAAQPPAPEQRLHRLPQRGWAIDIGVPDSALDPVAEHPVTFKAHHISIINPGEFESLDLEGAVTWLEQRLGITKESEHG